MRGQGPGWRVAAAAVLSLAIGVVLPGCNVSRTERSAGGERVDVDTPVGSLRVKTSDKPAGSGVGLSIYPGATPVSRKGSEGGGADVDLNLGSLQVRVRALSYRTDDAPADVERFYRKALAGYGTVIACRDNKPVGEPRRTAEGLTCDDAEGGEDDDEKDDLELRAGSPGHRHMVVLAPEGSGTRFVLLLLDLPASLQNNAND